MFKILGRNIKKSIGLFIIFFTISLFFSAISCYIENGRQSVINANDFFSDKSINFQIIGGNGGKDNITGNDFLSAIGNEDGIVLGENIGIDKGNNKNIDGTAIYFNKSCFDNPPLLTGRFFSADDFKRDEPIALIGKNLQDILVLKNNKKYLFYDDTYYEIIGIMGYKNKNSVYDDRFVVNLNTSISDNTKFTRDINTAIWRLDNKNSDARGSLKNIYNDLSRIDKNIQVQITNESSKTSPLKVALESNKSLIITFIIFILVLFFNIINASLFWVDEMKKEIGVRKALGGTNKSIALKVMAEYEMIALAAALLALLMHIILSRYTNIMGTLSIYSGDASVSLVSSIALVIFSLIIGFAASFIPMRQILKMETNDIIRGR